MSQPSVIIIGAGLGGLSTGAYAQMNGYQCQIFEHGRHPARQCYRTDKTWNGGYDRRQSCKPADDTG